jgi:hypothetical protein
VVNGASLLGLFFFVFMLEHGHLMRVKVFWLNALCMCLLWSFKVLVFCPKNVVVECIVYVFVTEFKSIGFWP